MREQALQQIITSLKTRGLQAGAEEGAKLVEAAKHKAEDIVAAAEARGEQIVEDARARAKALKQELDGELHQACLVGLEAFQQAVLKSLLVPTVSAELGKVLQDPTALTEIITAAAAGITSSSGTNQQLEVLLPESQRERLGAAFIARLRARVQTPVEVKFDDGFKLGFQLAPQGGGYLFDFSEGGLRDVFIRFLAPRFRAHFFGPESPPSSLG